MEQLLILIMKYNISILILLLSILGNAQDMENLVKAKPVTINGFVNSGLSYVDDNRVNRFADPLGYFATVGINFKFFQSFTIPLSFTYSNQQAVFNRPALSMLGASPSYKWITLHVGYRNFDVSPYLMSGSTVKGIGLELTPGNFLFSIFKGNLTHKYNYGYNADEISGNNLDSYNRNSIGGKIGFQNGQNYFHISFLKAQDDPISGDFLAFDTLGISPKANFGLGLHAGIRLWKLLSISGNIAGSALSSDINSNEEGIDENFKKIAANFIDINESTRVTLAYDAEIALQIKSTRLGFKYQHVDPEYATLGYIFLQQDLNNYTLTYTTALARSRLILSGNVGRQYTNTKEYFSNRDSRFIFNTFMNARVTNDLNVSAGYNNFNSEGNLSLTEVVDSLQITTNNVGYTVGINYGFGSKNNKSSINFNLANNKFDLLQGETIISDNNSNNYSLSYSLNKKEKGITISTRINANAFTNIDNNNVSRRGINIGFKKRLSKKFNFKISPSYDLNYTNSIRDGSVINIKLRTSYKISNKSNASFSANYKKRNTKQISPFSQVRTSISLNTRF
jgi:hypothetical protein